MGSNLRRVGLAACGVALLFVLQPVAEGQVKVSKTRPSDTDFKGFRVVSDRGTELEIEVGYDYSGVFGDNVAIGARMASDGAVSPFGAYRPGQASVGSQQTARVTITTTNQAPASFTTDQIVLQMYVGGGFVFLEEFFPYEKTWGAVKPMNLNVARMAPRLAAPDQVSPPDASGFSHHPRTTTLVWGPVPGAASYTVEIDCMHCCESGRWCSEVGNSWKVVTGLAETTYRFDFVGAQPGRWRVWAVGSNGEAGPKSGWWGFSFAR